MKSDWLYVQNGGTSEKMAPLTLVENVLTSENGPSLKESMLSNTNLLINGDFRIWQRGTSFVAPVQAYTADRWNAWGPTISSLSGGGMRASFGTAWQYVQQTTNDYFVEAGEELTISARMKSSIARPMNVYLYTGETYIGHLAIDATTSYAVYCATITIPSDISSITIRCQNATTLSSDVDIKYIKLEKGSMATPYCPRTYAEELAMCQRYFQKVTADAAGFAAPVGSTGIAYVCFPTPVTMRAQPTVTAGLTWSVRYNGSVYVPTSYSAYGVTAGHIRLALFFTPTFGVNTTCGVFCASEIQFDAEI